MKKFSTPVFFSGLLWALLLCRGQQCAAQSVTWPLTANKNPNAVAGSWTVTASAMTGLAPGGYITGGAWVDIPSNNATPSNSYEFKITATANTTVESVYFEAKANSAELVWFNVYYSTNGTTWTPLSLANDTFITTTSTYYGYSLSQAIASGTSFYLAICPGDDLGVFVAENVTISGTCTTPAAPTFSSLPSGSTCSGTTINVTAASATSASSPLSGNITYTINPSTAGTLSANGVTGEEQVTNPTASFTVTASNTACGTTVSTTSSTITIISAGTITASPSATICKNGTAILTETVAGGTWTSGNTSDYTVTSLTTTTALATWKAAANNVNVKYTSGACSSTLAITTSATIAPAAPTATDVDNCNSTSTLTISSPASGVTYTWYSSSTNSSVGTGSSTTVSVSGSYTVYETTGTCTSSVSNTVNAAPGTTPATPAITSPPSSVCSASLPITLSATDATGGATLSWSATSATINSSTGAISAVSVASGSTFTVTVTATLGSCTSTQSATITYYTTPAVPTITSPPASVCSGSLPVTLTASDVTPGVTYSWGATGATIGSSTGAISAVSVASGSTFTVTVTAVNGICSTTGTSPATITYYTTPATPSITSPPASVCSASLPVTLSATDGTSGATLTWGATGATINSSTGAITAVSVASGSTFTATVTATIGTCTSTKSATITYYTTPATPAITSPPASVCSASLPVTLSASDATSGVTYSWSATGATIGSSTGAISAVSVASGSTFTVTVTAVNGACSTTGTSPATITYRTTPANPTITSPPATVCSASLPVTLTASDATSGVTYSWSATGATVGSSTGAISAVSVASGSTFTVTVTAVNGACSTTGTSPATITYYTTPATPSITSPPSQVCSASLPVTLAATDATSGVTYSWSATGATIGSSTGTISAVSVASGSTFTVSVTATSNSCGSNNASATITYYTTPATPSISVTNSCSGSSALITNPVAGATFAWSGGGTSNPQTFNSAGTVTATQTANGCTSSSGSGTTAPLSVPSAPTTQDNSVIIHAIVSGNMTVTWTNGNATGGHVVIINTSDNFTAPSNNTTPTANTAYSGSGQQVVYNNTGSTVTISGLNNNTVYWIEVYGYNTSTCGTTYNDNTATDNPIPNVVEWTGNSSTSWTVGTNWSTGVSPSTTSCSTNILIPSGTNYQLTITAATQIGDLFMNDGAILNLNANLSGCGNFTGGSSSGATINGTGVYILNGSGTQTISGVAGIYELNIDNTSSITSAVSLASGANISVSNALDLQQGNFNVSSGTFTFTSASQFQAAILDNFGGYTGSLAGNVTAQRTYAQSLYAITQQHMLGLPVGPLDLSVLGAGTSSGPVTPQADCDEYHLAAGSVYGDVFSLVESNGATCGMASWYVEPGSTAATAGEGYSVVLPGTGTLSFTGAPNVTSSYSYTFSNSNWSNFTALHHPLSSGWHLVSNPYLATLKLNTTNTGIDPQVQIWMDNGGYSGSYQSGMVGSVLIAPFQAFMVHVTNPGSETYTINATDEVRTSGTFYLDQPHNCELDIIAENLGTTLLDKTVVAFNPAATDSFDPQFDANKIAGAEFRHNLYTLNNGKWMGINVLHDVATTATVPVGFEPGVNGNYSFTFNNLNTFDSTVYIYLEDSLQQVMYNVRNGNYQFSADSGDNPNRFVLHFTPPAVINTINPTCNGLGNINITQPGTANWIYTLTGVSDTVLASGFLNSQSPININEPNGTYTLTLTDSNNYSVTKVISLAGVYPVVSAFSASSNNVNTQTPVYFTNISQNANTYNWTFGDGNASSLLNPMHVYTSAGTYAVDLTATDTSGCTSNASQTIIVASAATGISITTGNTISLWSNAGKVYVDFTNAGNNVDAVIKIYDILGQELSNEKYTLNGLYEKQIDNVATGFVIVEVKNNDNLITKKLFINDLSNK